MAKPFSYAGVKIASRIISKNAKKKNFVCSPVSINILLSLIAAGSKGRTQEEFLTFLNFNNIDELKQCVNEILCELLVDGVGSESPRLSVANGIWIDSSMKIKDAFKHVATSVYKADVKPVNFLTKVSVFVIILICFTIKLHLACISRSVTVFVFVCYSTMKLQRKLIYGQKKKLKDS